VFVAEAEAFAGDLCYAVWPFRFQAWGTEVPPGMDPRITLDVLRRYFSNKESDVDIPNQPVPFTVPPVARFHLAVGQQSTT